MLQIADTSQVTTLRNGLFRTFTKSGCERHRRRLSDPSGGIGEIELFWNPKLEIWAYFSKKPHRGSKWFCWFGSDLGDPKKVLTPSIEINLTTNPANKSAGGRSLTDARGNLYLGHKGMLGGGRGGQMSMEEFGWRIRGFIREPVARPNNKEENVFILGDVSSPRVLSRIRDFVFECDRLRAIARLRSQKSGSSAPQRKATPKHDKHEFRAENDTDGASGGGWTDPKVIRRTHGRVVNALKRKLGRKALNGTRSSMRPDLYILDRRGHMQMLFEVKASSNTQSWFTALGQLVVYSASEEQRPQRVLVCPAPREDLNFVKALHSLGITVVTFSEINKKIVFDGLESIRTRKFANRRTAERRRAA